RRQYGGPARHGDSRFRPGRRNGVSLSARQRARLPRRDSGSAALVPRQTAVERHTAPGHGGGLFLGRILPIVSEPLSPRAGPRAAFAQFIENLLKRGVCWTLIGLAFVWAAPRLWQRLREESLDRRVAIAVDWYEVRDFAARARLSVPDLIAQLKDHG